MSIRPEDLPVEERARLRDLIAECLERLDHGGETTLSAFLADHPQDAPFLRARLEALGAVGLLPAGADGKADFPERLGDFRLLRRLGGGGMGVVYAAVQESLQREVALKMIRPEHLYFPGARERFRREVESVARLQHPGIVPVYVVGESNGVPFFAMELVVGRSLDEVIRSVLGKPLAELTASQLRGGGEAVPGDERIEFGRSWVEAALRIVLQVAEALVHAHERGVLHRDIKPSNVMVTPAGRARLVDFGLATIEGNQSLTRTGHNVGSLPYMAPEQVLGQSAEVGPWTDVYGLGVLLFEVLTLKSPFLAESIEATRTRILTGETPLPHRLNAAVPWDAETVCLKAIQRDRRRRYQSAAEFAHDLRNFLDLRPIAAVRPGGADRLRTWVQRHPIRTLLAVAGIVLLVAGPVVFAIQESFAKARVGAALADSEASFQQAMRAVDELLKEVGARELYDIPQMDAVRARLLAKATEHYAAFLQLRPNDRQLRQRAAYLAQAHGEALRRLGKVEEAAQQQRRSLELATALAAEAPADLDVQRLLAVSHYGVGYQSMTTGRTADAEAAFAQAIPIYRSLATKQPDNLDHSRDLADSLLNQANMATRSGRLDQAQPMFEEARDVLARIVAAAPERSDFRERLSSAWQAIGSVHRMGGRLPLARTALERAVELLEGLPEARRRDRAVRLSQAVALRHLGNVLSDLDAWDDAEKALRRSIDVRTALATDHPQVPDYRRDLAVMRVDLGDKLLQHQRLTEAEAELRGAIEQLEPLVKQFANMPEYASNQGLAFTNLGRVRFAQGHVEQGAEAFAVARRLHEQAITLDGKDPSYRLRLASSQGFLGDRWLALGDHAAAGRALQEAVDKIVEVGQRAQLPASAVAILFKRRVALANALLGGGKLAEATAVAEQLAVGDRAQRLAAAELLARCAEHREHPHAEAAALAAIELVRELLGESRAGLDPLAPAFAALRGREEFAALFR